MTESIYEEIKYNDEIKFILFSNYNFWESTIAETILDSPWIDIITYNLNFLHKGKTSVYKKLKNIAETKGTSIRIVFNKSTFKKIDEKLFDESFKNLIPCFQSNNNHAKMFLSKNLAYIGSANYSLGSDKNIESGVLISNSKLIKKLRSKFVTTIASSSKLLYFPKIYNEFNFINRIIESLEVIEEHIVKNKILENEDCYVKIADLRFISDINKFAIKMNFHPFNVEYDWETLMENVEKKIVSTQEIYEYRKYALQVEFYLKTLKIDLINKFHTEGGVSEIYNKLGLIE